MFSMNFKNTKFVYTASNMVKEFSRSYNYLDYLLKSKHRHGHGIHSPFVFEFVSKVMFDKQVYPEYSYFNELRNHLANSRDKIPASTLGAVKKDPGTERMIGELLNKSSVRPKFAKLLFRMIRHYKPKTVIELGTSIGVSTIHMAKGNPGSQVITIEGNNDICNYARQLFKKQNIKNIKAINGLFDDYLPYFEKNYSAPEMVFIDGNHTYEATLKYYDHFARLMQEGFLILDDINWSQGMKKAWHDILSGDANLTTIDLFFLGIIIKRKSLTPGNYIIRF